ncbi:MAG: cupin domain-containing protein [Betaproteobacteria bacterium]
MAEMRLATVVFAALLLQSTLVSAQDRAGPVDLAALQWTTLPNGAKVAVFMGNPKEPGPYGSRARLPANWRVAPHTHPEDGRVTTVVSGVFYWAIGEKFDESKLQAYGPGSVIIESRGVAHYAMTKEEGAEIQTNSTGPAGMQYLEPGK